MKNLIWGGVLIGIGLVSGTSVFLGNFTWFNLLFDTLGSYWVAKGMFGLVKRQPGPALPDGVDPGIASAANRILASLKEGYATPVTLIAADARDFGHLDLARYDGYKASMERRGFHCLGDFANTVVNQSAHSLLAPTILRICTSDDGAMVTAYFQVKPHMRRRIKLLLAGLLNLRWIAAPREFASNLKMKQCAEIETEFDDGSFLVTSNAAMAGMLAQPPSITSDFHPTGTPLPRLMDAHRANLGRIAHAGKCRAIAIRTVDEMLNMQKRLAAQKIAHRESVQWVTVDELRAFAGGNADLAKAIHREVQRQIAAQQAAA
ncbi:MAG TPA: hypothetical protein VLJ58_22310 [Ramlibacter sp.]|nr:hypothetical protein [Ramlibacter sp.]